MDADRHFPGAIAQLGERLICIQEVVGSIPSGSTRISVVTRKKIQVPNRNVWLLFYIVKKGLSGAGRGVDS